jgi:hypothetical protein
MFGHGQTAFRIAGEAGFESSHIIALPAMSGDRREAENLVGFIRVGTRWA